MKLNIKKSRLALLLIVACGAAVFLASRFVHGGREYTPLMRAAEGGDEQFFTLLSLLRKGTDVGAKAGSGATALCYAVSSNNEKAALFLLARGAKTNVKAKFTNVALQRKIEKEAVEKAKILTKELMAAAECEVAPLHMAALNGNSGIAELLIKFGADVNIRDDRKRTPLMYAVWFADDLNVKLLSALLASGADMKARDKDGHDMFWYMLQNDNISEEAKKLLAG